MNEIHLNVHVLFLLIQRSQYELPGIDTNNRFELSQSAEAFRKPTDEKCAYCQKPTQTEVRRTTVLRFFAYFVIHFIHTLQDTMNTAEVKRCDKH